jgi:hypothetical protein
MKAPGVSAGGEHRDMAEQPNLDPLGLWRDMLGQWERGLNNVANQAMGSDEFSRALHQITSLGLRLQQNMGAAMEKSLQALNLPSRGELVAISERIGRMEETLARIESALQTPAKTPDAAPRPARTRQPPAA